MPSRARRPGARCTSGTGAEESPRQEQAEADDDYEDEEDNAMTDEQLASYRQYWQNLANDRSLMDPRRRAVITAARDDVGELLADIERLRPIVAQIASVPDDDYDEPCPFCKESPGYAPIQHLPECPVSQARMYIRDSITGL
jgi:hypothetical protein